MPRAAAGGAVPSWLVAPTRRQPHTGSLWGARGAPHSQPPSEAGIQSIHGLRIAIVDVEEQREQGGRVVRLRPTRVSSAGRMRSAGGHCDRSPNGSARRLQALTLHRGEQNTPSERRSTPGHPPSPALRALHLARAVLNGRQAPAQPSFPTPLPGPTHRRTQLRPGPGSRPQPFPAAPADPSPGPSRRPRTPGRRRTRSYSGPGIRNTHYGALTLRPPPATGPGRTPRSGCPPEPRPSRSAGCAPRA